MKKATCKFISVFLVIVLFTAVFQVGFATGAQQGFLSPASDNLTLSADTETATPGGTVTFSASFTLTPAIYRAARMVVVLPAGLNYDGSMVYVGTTPAALTTTPAATQFGTSVVFDFNNTHAGAAQVYITATVASELRGNALSVRAELFLQQDNLPMPVAPNFQASFTLRVMQDLYPTFPTLPEIPVTPQVSRVAFNFNGGVRIGGGAQVQAVPVGGSAIEPYVTRQGYVFLGWDVPFTYVTQNLDVNALWTPAAEFAPIVPPIYNFVEGDFLDGRNSFSLQSHMPLIFYARNHISNFIGVTIDGRALTTGQNYAVTNATETNTTAIHLKASYLNTLSAGSHTLRVNFRGDIYAEAQFTVFAYIPPFYDVTRNDWFFYGVSAMHASRLLLGITDTQFAPFDNMTRGMVVTLLYRFAGEPNVTGFYNRFPDVSAGQYYTNAVTWASVNGIVTGHEDGNFRPSDLMTRQQFAAVLYRYQNALGSPTQDILADRTYNDFDQIALFARGAVNKLTMQGVFRDWPYVQGNLFAPENPVNRAEVATVMRYWIESIGW